MGVFTQTRAGHGLCATRRLYVWGPSHSGCCMCIYNIIYNSTVYIYGANVWVHEYYVDDMQWFIETMAYVLA